MTRYKKHIYNELLIIKAFVLLELKNKKILNDITRKSRKLYSKIMNKFHHKGQIIKFFYSNS